MFNSILIVCTGNICRSPMGERLLRQHLPGKNIASAGIFGLEGRPADARAREVAARYGISLDGHVARCLTRQMMREYELILAMEPGHLNHISALAPESRGKALLFGHWSKEREIPDPHRKSVEAFEYVFGLLGRASQEWTQRLRHKDQRFNVVI